MRRFIKIEGVHNFREFGNVKSEYGFVKSGKLYRSGHFSRITEKGKESLIRISPKTIVDLRRSNERNMHPNNIGAKSVNIIQEDDINEEVTALPPHLQFIASDLANKDTAVNYMIKSYQRLPFEPKYKLLYQAALKAIASEKTPIIIHCAAGKDRTGILCALILKILKVDDDLIYDDYLLTNKVEGLETIIENYRIYWEQKLNKSLDIETMMPFGIVAEEYLDSAFKAITTNCGSIENYLNYIGICSADLEQIRGLLIK